MKILKKKSYLIALGVLYLLSPLVQAHQPGNSSLVLEVQPNGNLHGEYHVADVDLASIDLMLEDRFRRVSGVAKTGGVDASTATAAGLSFIVIELNGERINLQLGERTPTETDGRLHTMIPFQTSPLNEEFITVHFEEFFAFDPQHRVVISLEKDDDTKVGLLTMDAPEWSVSLKEPGALHQFIAFTWEGVFHIWIGIDHILFLIALLLPSVLRYRNGKWEPVSNFHDAIINVLKVVTGFTIAHSITLSLAALQVITLPSRFVESVIALSVVLAALNNLYPVVRDRTWMVAFAFGLIHGFGFANVLADLQLPTATLAIALFSFNVGVELGQVAIVAGVFPIIFGLRSHSIYQPLKLRLGSAVIALIACGWMVDRVFQLEMMPF